MEQWFDRLTTPRKIEGRFDLGFDGELSRTAHRPERVEGWSNRAILEAKCSIVVRQGFDGEPFGSELRAELLSRTAHHPEEDRGAV